MMTFDASPVDQVTRNYVQPTQNELYLFTEVVKKMANEEDKSSWTHTRRARRWCTLAAMDISSHIQQFQEYNDTKMVETSKAVAVDLLNKCSASMILEKDITKLAYKANLLQTIFTQKYSQTVVQD